MSLDLFLFASLFGTAYSYFIYPVILYLLPKKRSITQTPNNTSETDLPFISIIITAYNEDQRIKQKINNTLDTSYPRNKREILIASDGSIDKTNSYVKEFESQGVRLIEVTDRKGKENAQLHAIKQAKSDILIFSDVATQIPSDAFNIISQIFTDPQIGAISSEDRFITEDGKIAGEGAYVKYEMWLRQLETRVNSLVGLSGSFFACRKQICKNWDINVPSDFNTALNCVSEGYAAVTAPDLLGYYPNIKDETKEYQRKLRTVIRGMAAFTSKFYVLNPFKFGIFSLEVFSHKLMRWLVPWFMLCLLITNTLIWNNNNFYALLLSSQLFFYGLAMTGLLVKSLQRYNIIKIPYFFMQVNIAIAHAGLQFISGKRITKWEPSKR